MSNYVDIKVKWGNTPTPTELVTRHQALLGPAGSVLRFGKAMRDAAYSITSDGSMLYEQPQGEDIDITGELKSLKRQLNEMWNRHFELYYHFLNKKYYDPKSNRVMPFITDPEYAEIEKRVKASCV